MKRTRFHRRIDKNWTLDKLSGAMPALILSKGGIMYNPSQVVHSPITKMTYSELTRQFQNFRQNLYDSLEHYCDSAMDLLDALSGNDGANSVAELSLNPLFRRGYSSLYKAIEFFLPQSLVNLLKRNAKNSLLRSNLNNLRWSNVKRIGSNY